MAGPIDDKTDGMEIISIGEIYQGPWDKKYWSSSRARDRYPHPVGYRAMRTHNGITYKMDILEGIKGPLFTINSTDGHSCSGQTPEIAWESFQKKGYSRLKVWRSKRFLGKMDGVEFFGLKNPHVQRLLRELVRNANASGETSLKSTTICNEASTMKHKKKCAESSPSAQLPPALPKPVAVKSRTRNVCNQRSVNEANLKRARPEDQKQRTEKDQNNGIFITSPFSKKVSRRDLMPNPVAGNPMIAKEHALSQSADLGQKHLDCLQFARSENTEEQEESPSKAIEKEGEASVSKDEAMNDMDLFASDTLDLPLDITSEIVVHGPTESSQNVKDEVPDSATDSPPEAEIIAHTANGNSENSEEDSMGEDIANSMMKILLPKALPLLNTYTRKKRAKAKAQRKSNKIDHAVHLATATVDFQSTEQVTDITSVAPDSFENDQHECDQTSDGAHLDSEASHTETNDSKISSYSNVLLDSNGGHILSTDLDSRLPNCGDIASFAPDSFENDQIENPERDRLPPVHDLYVGDQTIEAIAGKKGDDLVGMETLVQTSPEDISLKTREDNISNLQGQHNIPLSESIICRNLPDVSATKMREAFDDEAKLHPPLQIRHTEKCCVSFENKEIVFIPNSNDSDTSKRCIKLDDERTGLHLVGCYIHPMPISSVLLSTKGNEIYTCVLSGLFMENRTLFLYKTPIEGKMRGSPSFIGHAKISMPVLQDAFGREIALDSTGLQLTPDGQCLVLHNSIKVPSCSEQKIYCPCSACTSECLESNTVKVVQLKLGYVSVVVKLKTSDIVRCILVCEPDYLLAADEGGRLYLWLMNSTWSAQTEECVLLTSGLLSPYIVELKKIPNYKSLVVGHNGFGEFMLWDICKRKLVSRFSAPTISVSSVIPVNLFKWKDVGIVPPGLNEEEVINDLIDQRIKSENHEFCSADGKDVAIGLLISTVSDPCKNVQGRCWKLALLVKNTVILGHALDPSVTAVGTSLYRGIIGTSDGEVFMWELCRGMKVGNLHPFKDGVGCIATDETGAVAVAGVGSSLRLYVPTQTKL